MTVETLKREDLVERVLKKLRDMRKVNTDLITYDRINELAVNVANRFTRSSLAVQQKTQYRRKNTQYSCICLSLSCVCQGVLDILQRRPSMFTFKEACAVLIHCGIDEHSVGFIRSTITSYSLIINGFPTCATEDLQLAIYFFFEDVFGVRCNFELCSRYIENEGVEVVGLVFDKVQTKRFILNNLNRLESTKVEIEPNFEIDWILDCCCGK